MGAKEEAFRLVNQGLRLMQTERNAEAINCFLKALDLGVVGNDGLYNNLGIAYAVEYFYGKAIRSFEKALSINPGNEQARSNLIMVKGNLQRLRDSYASLERSAGGSELQEVSLSFETSDGRIIDRTMSEIESQ